MNRADQVFHYKSNQLHVEQVPVEKIARSVGTPFYVYSSASILDQLSQLQSGLKKLPHKICFAMKANSNIAIVQLITNAGAGVDIVSGGELFRASQAWVPGQKIVFSGVGKTEAEMEEAIHYNGTGIHSFNVESVPELETLHEVAKRNRREVTVALRFNPDVNARVHPYIVTGLKEGKFGLERKEIIEIVKNLNRYPWIKLDGLSIHIGSQIMTMKPFEDAFKKVRSLVDEINELKMEPLSFLDLGGGLGIRYEKKQAPPIKRYCQLIDKMFGAKGSGVAPLEIILEPGKLLVGNAGALISKVLYRKSRGSKDFLIVDGSMGELIRPALYGGFHEIIPSRRRQTRKKKTDVVGPICESADFLGKNRLLPTSLDRGDLLATLSAGAYGMTMGSHYNSRPKCAEVLVDQKSFRIIRHRETYDDLIIGETV